MNPTSEPQLAPAELKHPLPSQPSDPAATQHSFDFLRPQGTHGLQLNTLMLHALAGYDVEDELLSSKLGIAGVADLYRVTTDLHANLKNMMSDPNASGEPLREEFAEFSISFMGIKKCSHATAAAATMLHASRVSQGFNLRVCQSLQAGIGLSEEAMAAAISTAKRTGKLPDRIATHKQLDSLTNGDWMDLLHLTVSHLCFDENKELAYETRKKDLINADLSPFLRCSEALVHILQLHQAATTAYGSEFTTMYDLFNLIRGKLNFEVQHEINEIIATNKTTDLMTISWRQMEDLITDAWGTASRRPKSYYDAFRSDVKLPAPTHLKQIPPDQTEVPFTAHPGSASFEQLADKIMECQRFTEDGSKCNEKFTWTMEEQQRFKRLGYSAPKSCPKHRQPPRVYASGNCKGDAEKCGGAKVEQCKLFQRGVCTYGDQCKYSHVEAPEQLAITHHANIQSDDDEDVIVWHTQEYDSDIVEWQEGDDAIEW